MAEWHYAKADPDIAETVKLYLEQRKFRVTARAGARFHGTD